MILPIYNFKAINIKKDDVIYLVGLDKKIKVLDIKEDNNDSVYIYLDNNLTFYWGLYEKVSDNLILLREISEDLKLEVNIKKLDEYKELFELLVDNFDKLPKEIQLKIDELNT